MKILHVLNSPRAEGTVKLALDWLQEPGCTQEVFVLQPEPPELTDRLKGAAAWYGQGKALPAGPIKAARIVGMIRRTCRERRPDLVICWMNGFSPWVLGGARLAGVSRLLTHAGNPPAWNPMGQAYTAFCTFAVWLTGGRMVCCSHYVASEFSRSPGAFRSVLRVAYNCAPVEQIAEQAAQSRRLRRERRPRLIMVATLESHKDHATLLKAMPEVVRAIPDVQLRLAGDGSLRGRLEEMSASLGLRAAVEFLGSRRDVPALLGESDVFVFSTTREEGLGTVLVEALAAGLPIVASDVPACRETLDGGRLGKLVPPGDASVLARELVASIRTLAAGDGARHRDYLRQFSPPVMMDAYLRLA